MLELDQSRFLNQTYTETDFLDEIQKKVLKFSSLLFTVNSTALREIYIYSNSRNLLQFL
jgi:hypothetical protein